MTQPPVTVYGLGLYISRLLSVLEIRTSAWVMQQRQPFHRSGGRC
jgi:hypothetical protein